MTDSKELTLYDLLDRTNKEKPKPEDVKALRVYLAEHPEAWRKAGDMTNQNMQQMLAQAGASKAVGMSIATGITETKRELGFDQSPMLEKILIDQVILAKLHLELTTNRYIQVAYDGSNSINLAEYWEKRQTAAQARFIRATEALARVRKMALPAFQVNIATDGGQQVNIAGDLVKTGGNNPGKLNPPDSR